LLVATLVRALNLQQASGAVVAGRRASELWPGCGHFEGPL